MAMMLGSLPLVVIMSGLLLYWTMLCIHTVLCLVRTLWLLGLLSESCD